MRARQGVVEELSWFADVETDRLRVLPIHETDRHGHKVGLPSREETPRPLRVVIDEADIARVSVVVEGKIAGPGLP